MKQSSLVIKGFFKELAKYPINKYYSQPNTIQSSVGMIFKLSDNKKLETKEQFDSLLSQENNIFNNAELLFVQRAGYHSDRNACTYFLQNQLTLSFQEVNATLNKLILRPVKESSSNKSESIPQNNAFIEVFIFSKKRYLSFHPLGQLPKNFYYLKKKGKEVFISCHAYFLKSTSNDWEPKLNPDELRKFKWVKISDLLKSENYHKRNEIKLGVFERMPAFAGKIAKENILQVSMPELDLGMDRNLWGITLYIWSYLLQMALSNIGEKIQQIEVQSMKNLINLMNCFDLTFRPYSPYKIPATIIASGWHYLYRVRPFRYDPSEFSPPNRLLRNIFLFVFLIVLVNCYFGAF